MTKPKSSKQIEAYKHASDKRVNIPTDQSSGLMEDKDCKPVAYQPTIQSKDGPKLSWARSSKLADEIKAYPLYINEKVHPSHFVNALCKSGDPGLFADFNGLPQEATYQWYQHKGNWQNRIIRGESAKVMASLAAKEGLEGKVQLIYSDPPYGISFKSNFQNATAKRSSEIRGGGGTKRRASNIRLSRHL